MADPNVLELLVDANVTKAKQEIDKLIGQIEQRLARSGKISPNMFDSMQASLNKLSASEKALHLERQRQRLSQKAGVDVEIQDVHRLLAAEKLTEQAIKNEIRALKDRASERRKETVEFEKQARIAGTQAGRALANTGMLGVVPWAGPAVAAEKAGGDAIAAGMRERAREAANVNTQLGHMATQGKFAIRVLEAFIFYRGFVAIQTGIRTLTRDLIDLNHRVSLVMTQLPNMGEGMRGPVTERVMDVSRETGQSFQQVADALYQITSAGYSGAEAFRVLETTSKAAVAGGTDAANAFNAALAQMNSFGLSAEHINEVYDKQFQLVRRGIFSYEQLTQVVGVVSEAFAQAGQSIETANAALATVSLVFTGPQLARGATGIRNLAEALTQHREGFEKLGISTLDAQGNVRNLIFILEDLGAALDGMTTGERAAAISDLLPDVREQAGLNALLNNMDSLRRNYSEQVMALGDLDRAYTVFEDDIRTAGQQLRYSVESGFDKWGNSLGVILGGLADIDRAMPGFIGTLITATAAVTALALATAYLNKVQFAGGPTRGAAFRQTMKSPAFTRGGAAIGGFALGAGIAGDQGFSWGGLGGSLATGAGTGALFGMADGAGGAGIGAAIGAAAAGISYGISVGLKDEAPEVAKTFSDALSVELENRSGAVAQAIAAAIRSTTNQQGEMSAAQDFLERARRGEVALTGDYMQYVSSDQTGKKTFLDLIAPGRVGIAGPADFEESMARAFQRASAARDDTMSSSTQGELRNYVESQNSRFDAGLNYKAVLQDATRLAVSDAMSEALPGNPLAQGLAMRAFDASGGDMERFGELMALLVGPDGLTAFNNEVARLTDSSMELTNALTVARKALDGFATGDFGAAAEVFGRMGESGESLAATFNKLKRAGDALALAQTLFSMQVNGGTKPRFGSIEEARAEAMAILGMSKMPNENDHASSIRLGATTNRLMQETVNVGMVDMFPQKFQDRVAELMVQQVTGLSLDGLDKVTPEQFVAALFPPEVQDEAAAVATEVELGSNSLADALFGAADAVRMGIMESATYTADELEMLGEEFADLNHTVRKIGILKELEGIGQFFFGSTFNMDAVKQQFLSAARLGGENIKDLLGDPEKVLGFIDTLMEFGDVTVDNSQNNNIVVRIDGGAGLNTQQAAAAADVIIAKLNENARQRSTR